MLLTASRASPRARILHSTSVASSTLSPSTSLQTRALCSGVWSLHLGSSPHREGRRRHGSYRYRYLESLTRNMSWDHDASKTIKKAMAAFARASEIGHGKKYVNVDEVKSWSDDISGVRPGKNIEDVERSAMDHLIRGDKPHTYEYDMWRSPLQNIRSYLETQRDAKSATTKVDDTTTIDPITNRRRSKQPRKQPNPSLLYDDLDGYRPTEFSEIAESHGFTQKYDDLHHYGPVADGSSVAQQPQANKYSDLDKYGAVRWNEPDGLRKATPEEASKEYNDLGKYATTKVDNPFTERTLTPEEQSKIYNDLDKYKPVEWNEPDGLRKPTEEELSKNYDDLHKYGAVYWNEPDGLRKLTPEERSKDYKDLGKYGPVTWSEPDGLRRLTPEEESKKYDDLANYAAPFVAKNSTLRAHAAAQMDATPRGEPIPAKVDAPVEDLTSKYDDLDKYGPVRWNEPDGLRKLTPEELSKNYDDLHLYGAVEWNEPDGLRDLTPEEKSKYYRDIPQYAPRDLPGSEVAARRVHPEQASKNYKDLSGYQQYDNSDPEVPRVHPEELTKHYEDLDSYKPTSFDSVDYPYPLHPEEVTTAYKDLNRYSAVRHNEPDGKPAAKPDAVAQGLKEYDSKAGSQETRNGPSVTYPLNHRNSGPDPDSGEPSFDSLNAQEIRAATLRRAHEYSLEEKLKESDHPASLDSSQPFVQLTGNYTRDFPEEFAATWGVEDSSTSASLSPKDHTGGNSNPETQAKTQDIDRDSVEVWSMDESFPRENPKIQPALDRHVTKDAYSHEPQGLETSFAEECGADSLARVEKHYASKGSANDAPALYKILAFDATSQTMNIAEATTTMQESDSPSTLADVLLRLSSPSKFLPHFPTLQAEGYEVVSGSGDVLIFRKMRPASAQGEGAGYTSTYVGSARVNPIDMMGKPAVGNFASPTGFVNYDALNESLEKPEPPAQPIIGVNNDEAAARVRTPAGQRKKRRLGRKLVLGTAGIAGSAYAVSVTSEYLSTRDARREGGGKPRRL